MVVLSVRAVDAQRYVSVYEAQMYCIEAVVVVFVKNQIWLKNLVENFLEPAE